jgi:hypothetical protein
MSTSWSTWAVTGSRTVRLARKGSEGVQTETYKGRKLKVIGGRGRDRGYVLTYVNGVVFSKSCESQDSALRILRSYVDAVDAKPIDGSKWAHHWYAPGTYELCQDGHPREIGGECRHPCCADERAHSLA